METYPQSEANLKQRRQYSGEGSGMATAAPNTIRKKIIFFSRFFFFFSVFFFFSFFFQSFFLFSLKYQNSLTDGFQRVFKGLWLDTAADWSAVTEYLASECVHMFLCVHSYWSFPWEGKVHLGFFFSLTFICSVLFSLKLSSTGFDISGLSVCLSFCSSVQHKPI